MPNLYDGQIPWELPNRMQSHAYESVGYYLDHVTGNPYTGNHWSTDCKDRLADGTLSRVNTFQWRDPDPFVATLRVLPSSFRGSKIDPILSVMDGKYEGGTVVMFVSEFLRLITEAKLDKGVVKGLWGFRKQGANYSVVFMEQR